MIIIYFFDLDTNKLEQFKAKSFFTRQDGNQFTAEIGSEYYQDLDPGDTVVVKSEDGFSLTAFAALKFVSHRVRAEVQRLSNEVNPSRDKLKKLANNLFAINQCIGKLLGFNMQLGVKL